MGRIVRNQFFPPASNRSTLSHICEATSSFVMGAQVDNGAASFDYCHLVCVAAEPGAFLGKVVGHDEIEVLSDQLVFCVFKKVFGLSGKSDQHLSRRLNLSKSGENVRIGLEEDRECFRPLSLAFEGLLPMAGSR